MVAAPSAMEAWRLAEQDAYFAEHRWRTALVYEHEEDAQRLRLQLIAARELCHTTFREAMRQMRESARALKPKDPVNISSGRRGNGWVPTRRYLQELPNKLGG